MFDFNQIVSQPGGNLVLLMAGLALVSFVLAILAVVMMMRMNKRLSLVLQDAAGTSLEPMLREHLQERRDLQEHVRGLELRIVELEEKVRTAKRHLGLVKYDAFEDVGGNQSFALAIYDDSGNGTIITSIVGRMDCRVYAKPLLRLTSERTLSQEEERAIKEAKSSAPKSILS